MQWRRSPKWAAVGIALLIFSIVLAMESSGGGAAVLVIAIVGLALVLVA